MGLQFRRGTDSDRLGITPDIGEPLYTTNNKKLYIGDGVTAGGVLVSGDVSDSAGVIVVINQTVDSNYIQERQIVGPDASAVSNIVVSTVDSAYVQARQADIFRDSAFVTNIVDTAYIQARDRIRDSGFVEDIADSAYVQSRQDFAYSSLTGAPTIVSTFTNDANYLDSATVTSVIDASYIQANQITYDFLDSAEAIALIDSAHVQARQTPQDFAYSSLTGAPTTVSSFTNDANYLDSTTVQGVVDATYINSLTEANIDSAALIAVVDSAYVQARQDFAYSSLTGTPTALSEFTNDTNYLDSTTVQGVIDAAYVQANQTTYSTADFVDSNYVATQISNLVDGAPLALDTLNEIATALQNDSDALAALVTVVDTKLNTAGVTSLVDSAYVQARQILQDFAYSSLTGAPTNLSQFNNDTNYLDSTTVTGVIDASYIQANQITYNTSDFTDSAFVIGLPVSTFTNDANYLDSTTVTGVIDAAYINSLTEANIDSAALIAVVDSAYVQARQAPGTDSSAVISLITSTVDSAYVQSIQADIFRDSAFIEGVIDSAYINARVSSTDSAQVISIINGTVDSDYVIEKLPDGTYRGLRTYTFTADSGDTTFTGIDDNGNTLVYSRPSLQVFVNGILLVDSVDYTATSGSSIILNQAADSADVITAFNVTSGGLDSVEVTRLIPDGTFRGIRSYTFTADSGDTTFSGTDDNGNSLVYMPHSVVVYLNGILQVNGIDYTANDASSIVLAVGADSADIVTVQNIVAGGTDSALINQEILSLIDSAYVQARQTPGTDSAAVLALVTSDGFTKYDSADTLGLIDSAYIQARQSNPDQTLNSTDSVTFATLNVTGNAIIGGNLQVNGTTVTVNSEDLSVTDNMIYMNAGESASSPTASIDVGWAANVNDDGSYAHVGMFRDADDNTFKVYEGYTPEPDAAVQINTAHASFSLAPFAARTLTGKYLGFDSDVTAAGLATQSYVITTIDSAYVQLRQTPQDFAYSSLTGAPTTVSTFTNDANYLDSTTVQGVIDAAYVQANQTTYDFLDSAEAIALIATQGYLTDALDSAEAIALITGSDLDMGTNKILYSNVYDSIGALPNASSYHGMFAHVHATGTAYFAHAGSWVQLANNSSIPTNNNQLTNGAGYTTYDSTNTLGLIDSAYINARVDAVAGTDSAATIALIQSTVDSAYVAAREANVGGGSGGLDSAAVLAIIPDATLQGVNQFEFLGDSGQTVFTGADRDGNSLTYNSTDVLVFLNGTLMVPGNDFLTTNSSTITFTQGVDSGDFVTVFNFTAGRAIGGGVSEVNHFDFTADSGQTSFTGVDDDGSILSFIGTDNIQVFVNGILLKQSDYTTTNNNTITLTDPADSADEVRIIAYDTYSQRVSLDDYHYTADSGQTVFSGTDDDGNTLSFAPSNLQVHLNGILLRPGNDYTTTGSTSVTLVSGADSGDAVTITAISGDSAGYVPIITGLVDSAYINARVTIPEAGVDSASVLSIVTADGFTKYDSADTLGLIDSAYVQARQIAYSTADFADSAYVTAQINALIDGAPTTLDTLNEIAAALNDDDSAYGTLVALIGTKTDFDSADVRTTRWSDNERLIMGDGSDLEIYHNGGNSFVRDLGTGNLVLDTNGISIVLSHGGNAEKMAEFYKNGGIEFYNNNTKKAEVTIDGLNVIGGIYDDSVQLDSAWVQARQLTYDFLDSAEAIALIATQGYLTDAIDSARITSMLAADSFSIGGTVIGDGKIEIFNGTGSTPSYIDLYCEVSNAHYTRIQSADHSSYSGNVTLTTPTSSGTIALTSDIPTVVSSLTNDAGYTTYDSTNTLGLIDSAYINARVDAVAGTDSAATIALIQATVDSAYVAAREANAGGGSGGLDSASIINLIDSAYVQARQASSSSSTSSTMVTFYEYLPDSGATTISGNDRDGNALSYQAGNIQVYRNGILLVDSNDYTANNGSTVTLTTSAVGGDYISIASYVEGVDVQIKDYEFTADSGQTTFTGLATNGETLSYTADNIIVHLNGILLTDSADYTATNGSSIVLTTAADSADLLSIIAFTNTSAVNQYVEATTNITAIAGKKYIIDTSSTVTITLPSLPSFGDEVKVIDGTGNAGTNNITINRNSNKILGVDSDFTLDVDRAAIDLVYYNVTQGWIVSGNN